MMLIWVRVDGDYHIMEQDGDRTIAIVPDGKGAKKLATAICALPEMVEKIKRLESEREYLKDVLRGIRAHIETLDFAALGVDSEVGFSYRDEMVSRIDVAVASYESKE